jgi:hypothetical protein
LILTIFNYTSFNCEVNVSVKVRSKHGFVISNHSSFDSFYYYSCVAKKSIGCSSTNCKVFLAKDQYQIPIQIDIISNYRL